MLLRSLDSAQRQHNAITEEGTHWERDMLEWDHQEHLWQRELDYQHLDDDGHHDSGFAIDVEEEYEGGSSGGTANAHNRYSKKHHVSVHPPRALVAMPLRRSEVRLRQIASTLLQGLTYWLRPRTKTKRETFTLNL